MKHTTIGIDLGTSVAKGVLIDETGKILAEHQQAVPLLTTQPEWGEQRPQDWWKAVDSILKELAGQHSFEGVSGIGLSGQMHGLVTYDSEYTPVRPAIVWLDRRSQKEVEYLLDAFGHNALYRVTGNPVFTGFLLPSLMWVKRNEKAVYKKIAHVSSPKDYLALQLTGTLRSEPTDAMATAAFDRHTGDWSEDIITACKIKTSLFPEILPTSTPYGTVTAAIAKRYGIPADAQVYGGSDQSMGAMGLGLVKKGQAMLAVSTGGQFVVVAESGLTDSRRRLHTLAHGIEGNGLYMAATLTAALSMKWFKENIIEDTKTSDADFSSDLDDIPLGSDGVMFHPYLAGERTPYFNSELRASFNGLSVSHTRAHMQRAIMEGVAFSQRQSLEVFKTMGLPIKQILATGGGSKNLLWRQIVSSTLNKKLQLVNIENHSPYGAAIYALFAPKKFVGLNSFYKKNISITDTVSPIKKEATQYSHLFAQYESIADTMHTRTRTQ